MNTLLFLDANILLDFYRFEDATSAFLGHIEKSHDRIVTTHQVEMEFEKNRQSVIIDTLGKAKVPELAKLRPPGFLVTDRIAKALKRSKKQLGTIATVLQKRIGALLDDDPESSDSVYQCVRRLFEAGGACHLHEDQPAARQIERLALRRFLRGQPPRKEKDTSCGDAINWEWIVRCAKEQEAKIVIVSRDSDYGEEHDGRAILNDALRSEFRRRVGPKGDVELTRRMTEGFRRLGIRVSQAEVEEEDRILKERPIKMVLGYKTESEGLFDLLERLTKGRARAIYTTKAGLTPGDILDRAAKKKDQT